MAGGVNFSQYRNIVPAGGVADAIPMDPSIPGRAEAVDPYRRLLQQQGITYAPPPEDTRIWQEKVNDTANSAANYLFGPHLASVQDLLQFNDAADVVGAAEQNQEFGSKLRAGDYAGAAKDVPWTLYANVAALLPGLTGGRALHAPEKGGGGGGYPVRPPHPNNLPGSTRQAEVKGGMYLKSEQVLHDDKAPKNATVGEFIAFLRNNGVKPREQAALGLDKLDPKLKITKNDFVDLIKARDAQFTIHQQDDWEEYVIDKYGQEYPPQNYKMHSVVWDNPSLGFRYEYDPHNLPPNTVLHNRYTDRMEGNKKVTIMEEGQSDLAQQYRGRWVGTQPHPDRIEARQLTASEVRDMMDNEEIRTYDPWIHARGTYRGANFAPDSPVTLARVNDVYHPTWTLYHGHLTPEEIHDFEKLNYDRVVQETGAIRSKNDIQRMWRDEATGMPHAPYAAEGSKAIAPLSFKLALLEAARRGSDELVIAPGDIHAERWAGGGAETRKGLIGYYNDIYGKEAMKEAEPISKEMQRAGLPGLKPELVQKPYMVERQSGNTITIHDSPYEYAGNLFPSDMSAILGRQIDADHNYTISNIIGDAQYRARSRANSPRAVAEVQDIEHLKQRKLVLMENARTLWEDAKKDVVEASKKLTDFLKEAEQKGSPPLDLDKLSRLQTKLENAQGYESYYHGDFESYQRQIQAHEDAKKVLEHWENSVKGKGGPLQTPKAVTVSLTPEQREWLLKNGVTKYAKGGIVTLSPELYA